MLSTRCGRGVVMVEQRYTLVGNTCHDSRPSAVMTTCGTREAVERACVKRHNRTMSELTKRAILRCPRVASFRRGTVWNTPCSGWTPSHCFTLNFALPLGSDAVMCWPIQSDGAR